MRGNYLDNPNGAWFVARMGGWEWLETVLKLVAVGAAMWALQAAMAEHSVTTLEGRIPQAVVLAMVSLGILLAVVDRLAAREFISMAFAVVNTAGHVAMTTAVFLGLEGSSPIILFCSAMLAGDLSKLGFFWRTGLTVRNAPRAAVFGATGAFALAYLAVLLLEVL